MVGLYVTTSHFPELSYYALMPLTFQMLLYKYMQSVGKVLPLPHILNVIEWLLFTSSKGCYITGNLILTSSLL